MKGCVMMEKQKRSCFCFKAAKTMIKFMNIQMTKS